MQTDYICNKNTITTILGCKTMVTFGMSFHIHQHKLNQTSSLDLTVNQTVIHTLKTLTKFSPHLRPHAAH